MNKWAITTALVLGTLAPTASADMPSWQAGLDLSRADLKTFNMIMINEGVEAGTMTYGWTWVGDKIVVEDHTTMQPDIDETALGKISASTLLPDMVKINFSIGPSYMNFDFRWQDGKRMGTIVSKRPESDEAIRNVDLVEDNPAPLRLAIFGLLAGLPLEVGYQTEFDWFNSMANRTEPVKVNTSRIEMVETPAGSFECYVVEIRGTSPENNVYITKDLPRRIVRIDVVGQPMYFLRTAS